MDAHADFHAAGGFSENQLFVGALVAGIFLSPRCKGPRTQPTAKSSKTQRKENKLQGSSALPSASAA